MQIKSPHSPVLSPVSGSTHVSLQHEISVQEIVQRYRSELKIDVGHFFGDLKSIQVYRCDDTGYVFYEPKTVFGDGEFYRKLQENNWYYKEEKWEHQIALGEIASSDRVLEVGSGAGAFLRRLKKNCQTSPIGLEMNQGAATEARSRGCEVITESVEEHAKENQNRYDVICMFQVLEHIPNPGEVLQSCVTMLRSGGRLILAVPDNGERNPESLFVRRSGVLNMPPHHAGLWDARSLSCLAQILDMKIVSLKTEPAQEAAYQNSYRGLIKNDLIKRYGLIGKVVYAVQLEFIKYLVRQISPYLPAHSIYVTLQKSAD